MRNLSPMQRRALCGVLLLLAGCGGESDLQVLGNGRDGGTRVLYVREPVDESQLWALVRHEAGASTALQVWTYGPVTTPGLGTPASRWTWTAASGLRRAN